MTKSVSKVTKQWQINVHFNDEQYQRLLEIAIEDKQQSLYVMVKNIIIEYYSLPAKRKGGLNKMTLQEKLKEVKDK